LFGEAHFEATEHAAPRLGSLTISRIFWCFIIERTRRHSVKVD